MKNCYLIKIPFATKGEIKNIDNSLRIRGYANYAYDFETKKVIHEYLELEKANYRLTDKKMVKPTSYYLKPKARKFRDTLLDPITKHNPLDFIDIQFYNLEKEQISSINNYLELETTTVKEQFSYLSGSNISGAKTNSKASPLVCTEQKYFECNFSNPMKKLWGKPNLDYKISKTISLTNFISNNKFFKEIFEESNKWYFNDLLVDVSNDISGISNVEFYNENDFDNWVYPKNLDEKISDYIDAYFNGVLKESDMNSHKNILRNFYGSGVRRELDNKKIPFCSTKIKIDSAIIENAHIINFSRLVNANTRESILKAICPYNVLRIDSNHHKLFDKHKITFDDQGNVVKNNGQSWKEFLDIEKLPKETINFIKENYEYWSDYKINK
ncbi:MAG: MAG4270 family putative restriction endonuclease [Metamycoplasmataceae bacterium]